LKWLIERERERRGGVKKIKFDILEKLKLPTKTIRGYEINEKLRHKMLNFYKFIFKNFNVEILNNAPKNPFMSEVLHQYNDDLKFLAMSEGRSHNMYWIVLIPKVKF